VPALERVEAERCVEVLERLASAPVENRGPWQEFTEDDPLAPIRFSLPVPEEVRGSALSALAQLMAGHELDTKRVSDAVNAAFDTGGYVALAAALDALSRHPDLSAPVPLERLLEHPESRVRRAALKAMWSGKRHLPEGEALELVLADREAGVRHLLCLLAEEAGPAGTPVLERLWGDQDAWVRTYARTRCEQRKLSVAEAPDS